MMPNDMNAVFERQLVQEEQPINVGMVVGFILLVLSLFVLIYCIWCFRDLRKHEEEEEKQRALHETDSSASESPYSNLSALDLFLKGRQAALSEGFTNEPIDAFAIGYMDGAQYASTNSSLRKESLTDALVQRQAAKLGYKGESAEGYVKGFQLGFRNGVDNELPKYRDAQERGLLNGQALGLVRKDCKAYAAGYAAGDAAAGKPCPDDADLRNKAEKDGFGEAQAELYCAGYHDGVRGVMVTDVLSPKAAFQKGLSNAAGLGLTEDDAVAHATGFQEGYPYALVGDGNENFTKEYMQAKAAEAGFSGEAADRYCAGFEEGLDEGTSARNSVFVKGMGRADSLGLEGDTASAFATGFKNGCSHVSTGKTPPSDIELLQQNRNLQFTDEDAEAYILGFKEGAKSMSISGRSMKDFVQPEAVFEKALIESSAKKMDEEAAAAYASGRHDGYCHGLTGGSIMSKEELLIMAEKLGFEGQDEELYISSFQTGLMEGNEGREAAYQKGKRKASSIGITEENAVAYAFGYRDGYTDIISGEDGDKDLSESDLKKQAKRLGISKKAVSYYVNGHQDGERDGLESLAVPHVFSPEAAYAKGLIDTKAEGKMGDEAHAYASGYTMGYQRGYNGSIPVSDDDIAAVAINQNCNDSHTQKAFAQGFADGFDDGCDLRIKQSEKILSPTAALEKGYASGSIMNLRGDQAKAYAQGLADGYALGLSGHQRPKEERLMTKANRMGFSEDVVKHYVGGFYQGYKESSPIAINKNVVGMSHDSTLNKGLTKAGIHGMRMGIAKAYGKGYQDGYAVGIEGTEATEAADRTRQDIAEIAQNLGFTDKRQTHAYVAGYLAGQADGGAVVLHHSLCDVHRCASHTCETCRKQQEPNFVVIPTRYPTSPKNQEESNVEFDSQDEDKDLL
jgi:cbb3-type cytochrome oxidase subunit 3